MSSASSSPQHNQNPPIRIAIIGAGLAGLSLLISLLSSENHHNLDVHLFEAAPFLREEGAAIGLGFNAQQALSFLSPRLRSALDRAGGTPMNPHLSLMIASKGGEQGKGKGEGDKVCDVDLEKAQVVVRRTSLVRELLRILGEEGEVERVQWRKKVRRIVRGSEEGDREMDDEGGDEVRIEFEDGDVTVVDCVVGCDGLNSLVRQEVLRERYPEVLQPMSSGSFNFRIIVPLDRAIDALGEEYCSQHIQHGWIAIGGFGLTDFVDDGQAMQVIAGWSSDQPWPYEKSYVLWDKERLCRDLEEWGDFGRRLAKLFTAEDELYAANVRRHPDTPTYSDGRLCVVGDAAQAMSPALGAGAGQALEDVLILTTLLGSTGLTPEDVPAALEAYTKVRLPRRSMIARESAGMTMFLTGRSQAGIDSSQIRAEVEGKFDFSQPGGFDFDAMRTQALQEFEILRSCKDDLA